MTDVPAHLFATFQRFEKFCTVRRTRLVSNRATVKNVVENAVLKKKLRAVVSNGPEYFAPHELKRAGFLIFGRTLKFGYFTEFSIEICTNLTCHVITKTMAFGVAIIAMQSSLLIEEETIMQHH
jgi:hypothetical protein